MIKFNTTNINIKILETMILLNCKSDVLVVYTLANIRPALFKDIVQHYSYTVIILEQQNITVICGGAMVMCPVICISMNVFPLGLVRWRKIALINPLQITVIRWRGWKTVEKLKVLAVNKAIYYSNVTLGLTHKHWKCCSSGYVRVDV